MPSQVLLVDDEANVLRGYARALFGQPYRVLTARCVKEATALLKAHPVDLIVTDEFLGKSRGTELLRWVSANYPDVVRIVLTGQPNLPSLMRAINECGVFRFLTKPCNAGELAAAIALGLDAHAQVMKSR